MWLVGPVRGSGRYTRLVLLGSWAAESGNLALASQSSGIQPMEVVTWMERAWERDSVAIRVSLLFVSLIVIVIYLSILEDEEFAAFFTNNLLPDDFDITKYRVIERKIHRWGREAKSLFAANR